MNECISNNSLFLSENYMVQSVENMPVSIIDCDKMGVTQLIHSGQLTNVIQFADSNSSTKNKTLHPLEMEIQRDLEMKCQQEKAGKNESLSVIQPGSHRSFKLIDSSNSVCGVLPLVQGLAPGREDESENVLSLNRQLLLEKREYFIMSDNSLVVNVNLKDNKGENNDGSYKNRSDNLGVSNTNRCCDSDSVVDVTNCNRVIKKVGKDKIKMESDSENEEHEIEPVCDYEPDPESTSLGAIKPNDKEKPNKCYMCFKTFRQKKNMYAHIRKIHSTQPKIEGGILCPLCKMHALRQEHLRAHLETLHEIPIEREEKLFNTMEEFLSWKKSMEKETLSLYVSKSSSKLLANNQQKTYYKCHRSGTYIALKKETRKKKLKIQGSSKIGATCPAAIEVTENINGINVVFWKTHVGHVNDLTHLSLSKEEKASIMNHVGCGYSWNRILETFKIESPKSSSKQHLTAVQEMKCPIEECLSLGVKSRRQKSTQRRKPVKEKIVKRATQSLIIERAEALLNLLETTEIKPEFRPKVCLMIENLISTVKRRTIKKENSHQKRKLEND